MTRRAALAGTATFLIVPGTVGGLVPWWISGWQGESPLAFQIAGGLLIIAGVTVLLDSFVRFAVQGLGTPAPVAPTRHLVVTGWYRFVRNPMYVAVSSAIFGQGLLFGDRGVLIYGAIVWLFFHVFVLGYEEPTLRSTFGAEYDRFRAAVPRWVPRFRPWRP